MLGYLGRYTHRVAIANSRLVGFDNGQVSFTWKDYRQDGKTKVMTLSADEFIRRFLQHTVPSGFHRIRHIGFLANCHRAAKLALCRDLLAAAPPPDAATPAPMAGSPPGPDRCGDRSVSLLRRPDVDLRIAAANSAAAPANVVRQFMKPSQLLPLRSATSGNADHGGGRRVSRDSHFPYAQLYCSCGGRRVLRQSPVAVPQHPIAPLVAAALDRRTDSQYD